MTITFYITNNKVNNIIAYNSNTGDIVENIHNNDDKKGRGT